MISFPPNFDSDLYPDQGWTIVKADEDNDQLTQIIDTLKQINKKLTRLIEITEMTL